MVNVALKAESSLVALLVIITVQGKDNSLRELRVTLLLTILLAIAWAC